jgi:hypothetical protein
MQRVVVVDNSLVTVWVYPERKMIHHVMKDYCFGRDFREALLRGLDALERYRATKWLSDDRVNGPLPPDDLAWAADHWFPRIRAAGWKHWAIVQPARLLGQLNMTRISKMYIDQGLNARMFADPEEAMRWLDAQ